MPQEKEQSCKEDPKEETTGTPLKVRHIGEYLLTLAGHQMEMAQETLRMGLMLKKVDCLFGPSKTPSVVFQIIWEGQETFHVNITCKKGTTKSGLLPQLPKGVKVCAKGLQKRKGSLGSRTEGSQQPKVGKGSVMNLRDSPVGSNRLLSALDSITITKVNNIKANSTKYYIRAFTKS